MPLSPAFFGGPPWGAPLDTQFRGTARLVFIQNNEEGHPDFYKRLHSSDLEGIKRWFDDGCALFYVLHYVTDGDGFPKEGERQGRNISHLWWDDDHEGALRLVREGKEHWLIVADEDGGESG